MEVTYSLSPVDLPTWRRFYQGRQSGHSEYFEGMGFFLSIFAMPFGFFAVPLAVFAVFYFLGSGSAASIWATIAVAAIWGPLFWSLRRRKWERRVLQGRLGKEWTIGITPDGVTYASSAASGSYSWSSFADIGENSSYLFFFTNGGGVMLIPKRAFVGADEARSFADTAIAYWSAKRGERTPSSANASWPPAPSAQETSEP